MFVWKHKRRHGALSLLKDSSVILSLVEDMVYYNHILKYPVYHRVVVYNQLAVAKGSQAYVIDTDTHERKLTERLCLFHDFFVGSQGCVGIERQQIIRNSFQILVC